MVAKGPASPLVVGYFLLLALASLRFSLGLIWFATGLSMGSYLVLLGYARWVTSRKEEMTVPRYYQVLFLIALGLTGIILGQVIRRVRGLGGGFAKPVHAPEVP